MDVSFSFTCYSSFPCHHHFVRDERVQSLILFLQGSTGVLFSDVAGIDEAVDELQEVGCYCTG